MELANEQSERVRLGLSKRGAIKGIEGGGGGGTEQGRTKEGGRPGREVGCGFRGEDEGGNTNARRERNGEGER